MDYIVEYDSKLINKKQNHSWKNIGGFFAVTVLLAVSCFVIPRKSGLRGVIADYRRAYDFEIITEHLHNGDSLYDSATAFFLNALTYEKNN